MRLSEAFEQSLNVYRSGARLVGFCEGAGLIGALVGAVIVLLIWGRGSGRVSGYLPSRERPAGNTRALGGQTTVGRVLVDGPRKIAR